ncbi:MAG: TonB-dependent receptor, partial [Verrucomicrobiaceae bacterium]
HYKYLGLQVSHYDGTRGISITSNGADATTKGVELGMNFRPRGIEGLSVETFVAYNDAKYNSFPTSPCYGGQTLSTGCAPVSSTVATTIQDLSDERLQFAPRWTGNFNLAYTTRVADDYRLTLRGSLMASSRYNYTPANSPHGWQNGWATVDASVSLAGWNDQAEISLIGRNLTNKYYVVTGFDSGAVTPGVLSDLQAIANRLRQIMLQLTLRTGT